MSTFVQDFYIICVLNGECHTPDVIQNLAIFGIKPTHTPELGFSVSKFFAFKKKTELQLLGSLGLGGKDFGLTGGLPVLFFGRVMGSGAPQQGILIAARRSC